nr:hypothetical protein [Tanacetum cinerariifolium]
STKTYKQSIQFNDHLVGTVLNEPALGMILFNDPNKQDFVSVNDFGDLNDEALYNVQETFLREQDNDKSKDNNVAGPSTVNMVEIGH